MTWRCAQTNTLFLSTDISILSLAKKLNYDKHTKKCVCCQLLILQEKKSHTVVGWSVCVCMCVGSVLQHSHTRWGISPSLWPPPMPLPFMSCLVCLQAFSGVGSLFFWPLDQPTGAITATFCTMLKKKKPTILVQKSIKENVGLQIVLPKFLHSVAVLMYFHITTCINHYVMLCWLPVIWNP